MRTYSYEKINEKIQELMKILATDYPNNAEVVITPAYAEIRYVHTDMNFLAKKKDTVDPESLRPKGRWLFDGEDHFCSRCYRSALCDKKTGEEVLTVLCPNCGADMRGDS